MLEECCRLGREGIPDPARGPVGIPPEGPVGTEDRVGPVGIDGDTGGAGRLTGVLPRVVDSWTGRTGAAPQVEMSGRVWRSFPKDPLPPLPMYAPRGGGTYPRGPEGGMPGAEFSALLCAETGVLLEDMIGD